MDYDVFISYSSRDAAWVKGELQGADAHLVLAQWTQSPTQSREHAEKALRPATCDGPLDFTYKAAYEGHGAPQARLLNGWRWNWIYLRLRV